MGAQAPLSLKQSLMEVCLKQEVRLKQGLPFDFRLFETWADHYAGKMLAHMRASDAAESIQYQYAVDRLARFIDGRLEPEVEQETLK